MKKRVMMLISSLLLAITMVATVMPKEEVNAYTCYADMTYDEVVAFWSAQPLFQQVFDAEANLSSYSYEVKHDKVQYFKLSLTDCACHPNELKAQRPMTYNYMAAVLSYSSPAVYNTLLGRNTSYTLHEMLLDEINSFEPTMSYDDKCSGVCILEGFLKRNGVYNIAQYKEWKKQNGGKTAYEVYRDHMRSAWDESYKKQYQLNKQLQQEQLLREQAMQQAYEQAQKEQMQVQQNMLAEQQRQEEAMAQAMQAQAQQQQEQAQAMQEAYVQVQQEQAQAMQQQIEAMQQAQQAQYQAMQQMYGY